MLCVARLIADPPLDLVYWVCYLKQPDHSLRHGKTCHSGHKRKKFGYCNTDSHQVSLVMLIGVTDINGRRMPLQQHDPCG